MSTKRQYLTRGSLRACINHMLVHWRVNDNPNLSIVHHERAKYYAVVDDAFLNQDQITPGETGCRLLLRCTLKELKILCSYTKNAQTELKI